MRALTVRQPWAWAIIHGGKDVENRTRNVAGGYRGPVAIHAGLVEDGGQWPAVLLRSVMQADMLPGRRRRDDVRGAFIGVVDLVEVYDDRPPVTRISCYISDWAEPGAVHLVLANPRPLEVPIPARGQLGLWTPSSVVVEQLQAVTQ